MKHENHVKYKDMKNIPKIFVQISLVLFFATSCASTKEVKSVMTAEKRYEIGLNNYLDGDYLESETDFRAVIASYPLSPYAAKSQLLLADSLFAMEEFDEAGSYYTTFITLHPDSEDAEYALFQKGMSHLKNISTIERDQRETKKALFAFKDLLSFYGDSKYSLKAEEMTLFLNARLAEREFYVGRFYYKDENYHGALARFRNVLKDYSDTEIVDKTLFYIAESYIKLGEVELAKSTFLTLLNEFPSSPYISKVSRQARGS